MEVWQWGTFDVANFGDLLFPLVARRRLGAGASTPAIHAVSPTASPPVWSDALPSIGFADVESGEAGDSVSGILLGGGHIVAWDATALERYHAGPFAGKLAYPLLWLGAAAQAARTGRPLCWNAPGIKRKPVAAPVQGLLRAALEASAYVSVRDRFSRGCLEALGTGKEIHIVPDTALEVSLLWPSSELEAEHAAALGAAGFPASTETLAVHVNRHYAKGDVRTTADAIDQVASRTGLVPFLIALGPVHGDSRFTEEVAAAMSKPHLLLPSPASLRQATAVIGCSRAYLGSSMHGMITALSSGTPGLMVVQEGAEELNPKFTSLLEPLGLISQMSAGWEAAPAALEKTLALPASTWDSVLPRVLPELDAHWERVAEVFLTLTTQQNHPALTTAERYWTAALCLSGENDFSLQFDHLLETDRKAAAAGSKKKGRELRSRLESSQSRVAELEGHWTHQLFRTGERWKRSVKKRMGNGQTKGG